MNPQGSNILVTGARGLLGRYVVEVCTQAGIGCIPTWNGSTPPVSLAGSPSFTELNFKEMGVDELARQLDTLKVSTVLHLAAQSNVDWCEKNPVECHEFNVACTERLALACRKTGATLAFASSNAVYDGVQPPFSEQSRLNPLHSYGRSKRDAEQAIIESGADYLIFRVILAFGWNASDARDNPLTQLLRFYKSGKRQVKMVDDIYANTLYAGQAARAFLGAISKGLRNETFNVAGGTRESRYGFAVSARKIFGLHDLEIEAVPGSSFTELVPRPRDTTFDCSKMEKLLGVSALSTEAALEASRSDLLLEKTGCKSLLP